MLEGSSFVGFVPTIDADRAHAFYVGTLGLPLLHSSPFGIVVDAGGSHLRITPVGSFTPHAFTAIGWSVPSITDAVRDLNAAGVTCERFEGMEQDEAGVWTAPTGARIAWFKDPDGNVLSVTEVE